jgi:hypothetical protein
VVRCGPHAETLICARLCPFVGHPTLAWAGWFHQWTHVKAGSPALRPRRMRLRWPNNCRRTTLRFPTRYSPRAVSPYDGSRRGATARASAATGLNKIVRASMRPRGPSCPRGSE